MFVRKASLEPKMILAKNGKGKFEWRDFVKQATQEGMADRSHFLPQEAFEYDTDNFVFIIARAISGMEKHGCNGNYDAFPWEEIRKAMNTYPGCGFYIEHDEDSCDKAQGIVLDVYPNEEEQYLMALCAIDKAESPDLCQKLIDGIFSKVSMSCTANKCVCSVCGNEATDTNQLCIHMNPDSPQYCKGQVINGSPAYETNYDLCFTGLSAVADPADKDAAVFGIKASKKNMKLQREFRKYASRKKTACECSADGCCGGESCNIADEIRDIMLQKIGECAEDVRKLDVLSMSDYDLMKLAEMFFDAGELTRSFLGTSATYPSDDIAEECADYECEEYADAECTDGECITKGYDGDVAVVVELTDDDLDHIICDDGIDASLSGDNDSYTPFCSSGSKNKKKAFLVVDDIDIEDFEPWGQAVDTKDTIIDSGKSNEFNNLIVDTYPDGIGSTELNDLLAYSSDWIYESLGISIGKWEVDYTDEYEYEEEAREAYAEAIEDYPEEDHVLYNGDDLIESYDGKEMNWVVDDDRKFESEEEAREAYRQLIESHPDDEHSLFNGLKLVELYEGKEEEED